MHALTLVALWLSLQSPSWAEFSLVPAKGKAGPQRIELNQGRLESNSISLKLLIATATGVPPLRVAGPDWIDSDRYAIKALLNDESRLRLRTRAEDETPVAQQFRELLRQELISRFHLEYRFEKRDGPSYVLQAAEGRRLNARRSNAREPGRIARSGTPFINVETTIEGRDVSLRALCGWLQNDLKAPVEPDPALPDGLWSFRLKWQTANPASLFDALRTQLGLELFEEPGRQTYLIVDRADRTSLK